MFDIKDPTLDCLPPAPLILDDYSTTKCNRNDIKTGQIVNFDAIEPGFDGHGSPRATTDQINSICNWY